MKQIKILLSKDTGASLVEYSVLVALLTVVSYGAIQSVGSRSADKFCDAAMKLKYADVKDMNDFSFYYYQGKCDQKASALDIKLDESEEDENQPASDLPNNKEPSQLGFGESGFLS